MTFAEIERALDAGELQMMRPWGDYVPVRRSRKSYPHEGGVLHVFMENEVTATIGLRDEQADFRGFRIVRKQAA